MRLCVERGPRVTLSLHRMPSRTLSVRDMMMMMSPGMGKILRAILRHLCYLLPAEILFVQGDMLG